MMVDHNLPVRGSRCSSAVGFQARHADSSSVATDARPWKETARDKLA